jgi:hypothetical protein
MHAIYPDTGFRDDEAGCTPHWSRSDSGQGPRSFVYPPQARPERRQVSPRLTGRLAPAVESPATRLSTGPGLTPSQWLAQWCCLEEQT